MEELFKELEAPPTTSQSTKTSAASGWASDLAGLSQAQTQPTFSMSGAPFGAPQPGAQPFGGAPSQPFGAPGQPFGQPGFGGQPAQPFGAPAQPGMGGGFQPQPAAFGAQPNPFGVNSFYFRFLCL